MGSTAHVFASAILVALVYLFQRSAPWQTAARMLRRLRWFFLSLAVLFFWFTPGDPLIIADSAWTAWLPTRAGLLEGVTRITALVVIVLAVNIIIATTPREQLLMGLLWLSAPLEKVGIQRARFALRVVLVLGAVPRMQEVLGSEKQDIVSNGARGVTQIGTIAGRAVESALCEAEKAPLSPMALELGTAPPFWQWTLPAILIAVWWML